MLEEERKYEVDPRFTLPELAGALPAGGQVVPCAPVSLRATYYDTVDLRLARREAMDRQAADRRTGNPARDLAVRTARCHPG
jgi:inorganic triphosphatase YgiF